MSLKHTELGLGGNTKMIHFQTDTVNLTGVSGTQVLVLNQYESPVLLVSGAMIGDSTLQLPDTLGGFVLIYNQATGGDLSVKAGASGTLYKLSLGGNTLYVPSAGALIGSAKYDKTFAMPDANTVLTVGSVSNCSFFEVTGTLTAGRDLTFPLCNIGLMAIKNSTGQTLALKLGATTIALTNGTIGFFTMSPTNFVKLI